MSISNILESILDSEIIYYINNEESYTTAMMHLDEWVSSEQIKQ